MLYQIETTEPVAITFPVSWVAMQPNEPLRDKLVWQKGPSWFKKARNSFYFFFPSYQVKLTHSPFTYTNYFGNDNNEKEQTIIKLTTHLSRRLLIFLGSADSNFSFLTPRWILSKSVSVCPWSVSKSASSFLPGCSFTSINLVWIVFHFACSCSSSLINLRYEDPLGVLLSSWHVDSTEFKRDWFRENSSSRACCYKTRRKRLFYVHSPTNRLLSVRDRRKA